MIYALAEVAKNSRTATEEVCNHYYYFIYENSLNCIRRVLLFINRDKTEIRYQNIFMIKCFANQYIFVILR
jgi:hypothetical protein